MQALARLEFVYVTESSWKVSYPFKLIEYRTIAPSTQRY
jgi:hypothetical protein